MLDYVKNLADVSNYPWIAQQVFMSDDVNIDEMTERFIQSVEHYTQIKETSSSTEGKLCLCK